MNKRYTQVLVGAMALVFAVATAADARLLKVGKRYTVFDIYGGFATPYGEYNRLGTARFMDEFGQRINVDADQLFDETYFIGVEYGRLVESHLLATLGFRYTDLALNGDQTFTFGSSLSVSGSDIEYRQYDFTLDGNYLFTDITSQPFAPYAGAGIWGGWSSLGSDFGFNDDEFTIGLNLNFGFDLKVSEVQQGGSFVTISSMNSLNLLASDERPKYLNLGVGLKYYFRP